MVVTDMLYFKIHRKEFVSNCQFIDALLIEKPITMLELPMIDSQLVQPFLEAFHGGSFIVHCFPSIDALLNEH